MRVEFATWTVQVALRDEVVFTPGKNGVGGTTTRKPFLHSETTGLLAVWLRGWFQSAESFSCL